MPTPRDEVIAKVSRLCREECGGDWAALFARFDENGDGLVSPRELRLLLQVAGVGSWPTRARWVAGVMAALDRNEDGGISLAELRDAMGET